MSPCLWLCVANLGQAIEVHVTERLRSPDFALALGGRPTRCPAVRGNLASLWVRSGQNHPPGAELCPKLGSFRLFLQNEPNLHSSQPIHAEIVPRFLNGFVSQKHPLLESPVPTVPPCADSAADEGPRSCAAALGCATDLPLRRSRLDYFKQPSPLYHRRTSASSKKYQFPIAESDDTPHAVLPRQSSPWCSVRPARVVYPVLRGVYGTGCVDVGGRHEALR